MDRRDIDLLKKIDVFGELDEQRLQKIAPLVSLHRFMEKQVIYMPSDPRARLYAIVSGKVKLAEVSPEGKELVLCVLGKGDVFGELCLFDKGPHSTLATAIEDSEVVTIKCSDLANFMAEDAALVKALGKHVGEKIRLLEQKLSELVFKDVSQRLAGLLLDLAHDYGHKLPSGEQVIEMKITHQDLAGLIGSTRETTTTTLNLFREKGLIDFRRREIVVRDLDGLEEAADRHSKR
ncbi:MAG: Crp/Fnr family transcriptional regulator [Candidatus Abyssobacteria bacterium SURF_5]|jgi:CRP/FNR family transcriptional regulator|uniref:Crp/Fnr family transcriptional regulator n=1 Tax=Abyssobacteria bacterium (strain SURF_5) TaxID=2093360 RepID=A0A3A4NP59_ABYX5|nr:MAG: Crp/Fnr family transcriptional regulator [Candidatus Abyssubacteria bacterium SURF_5]